MPHRFVFRSNAPFLREFRMDRFAVFGQHDRAAARSRFEDLNPDVFQIIYLRQTKLFVAQRFREGVRGKSAESVRLDFRILFLSLCQRVFDLRLFPDKCACLAHAVLEGLPFGTPVERG